MTLVDEFPSSLGDQTIRKFAQAVDAPTDPLPRFENGNVPPGALQIMGGRKSSQSGTDHSDCSIVWGHKSYRLPESLLVRQTIA
jgi:hypothetical protein